MGGDERGDGPVGLARLCEELTALRDSDDSEDSDGSSNVVPAPPDGGARLLRDVVEAARCAGRLDDDDDDERWVPLSGSSGHVTRRRLVASLRDVVDACGGRVRIADAAAWCDVDASVAERVAGSPRAETDGRPLSATGVLVPAARRPEERAASARRRVRGVARASDAPTTVGGIAAAAGIDDDDHRLVRRLLAEEARGLGDLGADGRYAPRVRAVRRRRAAARALATRGWTADAVGVDVDAEDVVRTPRGGVVFDRARVLGPLREELLSDVDAPFVDARRRLPEGFWEALADDDEDARFVLTSALPDDDDGDPPLVAVSDGEALVVSPRAVARVRREIVPPLVEDFAARRAREKLATTTKEKGDPDSDDSDDDVLSLSTVAAAVAAAYSDEAAPRNDDDRARLFSALVRAVVGPSLASLCRDRVDAEVRRARSDASRDDDVAARFEANFADACLWTRACLKGSRKTGADDETSRRVAVVLARRVVARAAHRRGAEAAVLLGPTRDDDDGRFHDPVDLGRTSRGGATRLVVDEKALRDSSLPREAAAAVIELWTACGGARRTSAREKEQQQDRPPFSAEAFLRCAEENCL